jgi:hypothetical protein
MPPDSGLQIGVSTVRRICRVLDVKIVAYRRVSRQKQARNGLDLEAREADIQRFGRERGARIIWEYTDGGKPQRRSHEVTFRVRDPSQYICR